MNQVDSDAEENSKTKTQNTFFDIFSRFYRKRLFSPANVKKFTE